MTSADACSDQTTDPHAGHASEIFEGIGRLYLARYGRLRPGKDDRLHDSMDDENVRQFSWWIKYEALDDAVMQIERQASEIERLNNGINHARLCALAAQAYAGNFSANATGLAQSLKDLVGDFDSILAALNFRTSDPKPEDAR